MRVFNDIDNVPYWNWQQANRKSDLRYLVYLDNYLDIDSIKLTDDVQAAYDKILSQYNDEIVKRPTASAYFDLDREILELDTERTLCLIALSQVEMFSDKPDLIGVSIDFLSELGYDIDFSVDVYAQCVNIKRSLDTLVTDILELEKAKNSKTVGESVTDEQLINAIEKYRKVAIDTKKISLLQFLTYENDYIKYIADASNKK